ncbi:hypothetical protein C8R45DRAFT_162527 [Mycena sanguinolenta]|nr:hypothetical protein C8R45DRAFT_162527 [Mycena sanguinolenta]
MHVSTYDVVARLLLRRSSFRSTRLGAFPLPHLLCLAFVFIPTAAPWRAVHATLYFDLFSGLFLRTSSRRARLRVVRGRPTCYAFLLTLLPLLIFRFLSCAALLSIGAVFCCFQSRVESVCDIHAAATSTC